jgi:hypothetical protein
VPGWGEPHGKPETKAEVPAFCYQCPNRITPAEAEQILKNMDHRAAPPVLVEKLRQLAAADLRGLPRG